jgi:hypothetical protein
MRVVALHRDGTVGSTLATAASPPPTAWRPPAVLTRWVPLIAVVQGAVLLVASTRYGYHRDEMYFIVAGSHPAFGYPDQPPLVPLICWAMHSIGSGSLAVVRAPSALVAGVTTILAALIAREVGGDRNAQVLAAVCAAVSGFALATGHFVTTTTFDLLSTTLLSWLLVRAVVRHSGICLLVAGAVTGVGVEAKPQVGLVAVVMVAALLVVGPRSVVLSKWMVGGAILAAVPAAPYVVWQQLQSWPQLTVADNIAGSAEGGRIGFVPFQLVMVSPVLVPVWVAGLLAPLRRPSWRALRFVPIAFAALAIAYVAGNGKAYYLASLYPLLLGLGAIPAAEWARRARGRTIALTAAVAISGVFSGLIALPLLPAGDLQGSIVMAINPDQGETVGWPRFMDTIAAAWRAIPAPERRHTAIFTGNYGEAGAIDLLAGGMGLPRAYSGHNGYSEWGMPPVTDTHALVVGYDPPSSAAPQFVHCRVLATVNNGLGLQNDEQGMPVMLCAPSRGWPALWPQLTHLD